jgi:hypothetical protein
VITLRNAIRRGLYANWESVIGNPELVHLDGCRHPAEVRGSGDLSSPVCGQLLNRNRVAV